jgi:2-succinyl-6-hydroxy-2,4-cyclohexadiene-1-carboxylate synthase
MWDGVVERLDTQRYRPLALDLPGHGRGIPVTAPVTFESCVSAVLEASPDRFALCGYSMGGRIALHVALAAPERVSRLILVSSSPGIEDDAERAARHTADLALAGELERAGLEPFVERWSRQELFAEDPPAVVELARADQRRNDPVSLAAALRGLSTGAMPSLWRDVEQLRMPVRVVAGDRDAKFRALGERLCRSLPDARMLVLAGGHRLALENPHGVADALRGA